MRLVDRVAIITGAAMGIGWGITEVLLREGAKVVMVDVDDEAGRDAALAFKQHGRDVEFVHCDVTQEEQIIGAVHAAVELYATIDILVNNAGIGVYKNALEASSEDFDRAIATNLRGTFLFSKYCIPVMLEHGGGVIINISSVHSFAAVNGVAPYGASKGGVTQLTRNLAIDHGPAIRVNSVAPGWILSPNVQRIFDEYPDPAAQRRLVEDRQVMKRLGLPLDVGNAVAFLASDEASYITGTQLYVDGGMTAQLETW